MRWKSREGGLAACSALSPLLAQRRELLAVAVVHRVMATRAKADKIPGRPGIVWVAPGRETVVHGRRRAVLSVSQALLAQVVIAAQDAGAQRRPALVCVDAGRYNGLSPPRRPAKQKEPEPANKTHTCCLPAPALKALASRYVDYDLVFAIAAKHWDVDTLRVAADLCQPPIAVAYWADEITRPYG